MDTQLLRQAGDAALRLTDERAESAPFRLFGNGCVGSQSLTGIARLHQVLNQDYEKYMCCSSESGYVVPSPGMTTKENTGTGDQADVHCHEPVSREKRFRGRI